MWSHPDSNNIHLKATAPALSSWSDLFPLQPGWGLPGYLRSWPFLTTSWDGGEGVGREAACGPLVRELPGAPGRAETQGDHLQAQGRQKNKAYLTPSCLPSSPGLPQSR